MLGTFVEVSVQDNVSDKALADISNSMFAAISGVEQEMGFHHFDSALSFINRHAVERKVAISSDMYQVINTALTLSKLTQGRYDITVSPALIKQQLLPDYHYQFNANADWQSIQLDQQQIWFEQPVIIDLGGIAKGFAVDKAIAAANDCEAVVNAGGDMKMTHWQDKTVSIRLPNSSLAESYELLMQSAAVASSGHDFLTDNTQHIVDPKGRINVDFNLNVSVFADSCMLADALTKVVYLEGDSEPLLSQFNAIACRFDKQGLLER